MALMTLHPALDHDWLGACRAAAEGLRSVLRDHPTSRERVIETGETGGGGDRTLVIDAEAEDRVFTQMEALHDEGARFTVVSEERGTVDFGSEDVLVVVDPIDGSLNAKRGLPHHALSVAVATGPTMADVVFGYVYDLGPGEEWRGAPRGGAGPHPPPGGHPPPPRGAPHRPPGAPPPPPARPPPAGSGARPTAGWSSSPSSRPTRVGWRWPPTTSWRRRAASARWGRSRCRCARSRRRGSTRWPRWRAPAPSTRRPRS